jgi:FKBP-type peptidyl-prolyl cis-trans isomerase
MTNGQVFDTVQRELRPSVFPVSVSVVVGYAKGKIPSG